MVFPGIKHKKIGKIKTYSETNCPGCGQKKPHRYPGPCDECDCDDWEDVY